MRYLVTIGHLEVIVEATTTEEAKTLAKEMLIKEIGEVSAKEATQEEIDAFENQFCGECGACDGKCEDDVESGCWKDDCYEDCDGCDPEEEDEE